MSLFMTIVLALLFVFVVAPIFVMLVSMLLALTVGYIQRKRMIKKVKAEEKAEEERKADKYQELEKILQADDVTNRLSGALIRCTYSYAFAWTGHTYYEGNVYNYNEPECSLKDIIRITTLGGDVIWDLNN